jgi:hypothetical protein
MCQSRWSNVSNPDTNTRTHTHARARAHTHSHLHFIYLLVTWLQGGHHTIHLFLFFNLFLYTCSSSGPKAIAQSISAASMICMAPMEILKTAQNSSFAFTCALAQILKSQCFSTFTIERHCREYFWDYVPWPSLSRMTVDGGRQPPLPPAKLWQWG